MKYLHEKSILPYNIRDLFDLVIDIESYPEFLPWVSGATIITQEIDKITADLTVNFGGFKQSYRSNIICEMATYEAYIEAESHTGPFKHLRSRWDFQQSKEASNNSQQSNSIMLSGGSSGDKSGYSTLINFTLEFELKSKLMTNLVSSVIIKTQKQMIDAFANRAKEKYEKKS